MDRRQTPVLALLLAALAAPVGCDSDGVDQGPITITATNGQSGSLYVGWTVGAAGAFALEKSGDGSWKAVVATPPGCMESCSGANANTDCRVMCGPSVPRVKVLRADDSVSWTWPGKLHPVTESHCSEGRCYREVKPDEGRYRFSVCPHDAVSCTSTPCPAPDADGAFNGSLAGAQSCFHTELEILYPGQTLGIAIK